MVDDLTERLRRLARYGAGWDGYRAEPASPAAIEAACAFVAALGVGEGLEASLDGDGTVNVGGTFPGGRFLLTFDDADTVTITRRADGAWLDAGSHPVSGDSGRVEVVPPVRAILTGVAVPA